MAKVKVDINDLSPEVRAELQRKAELALKMVGETAEGYAKEECPVDTGRLRNSITYDVREDHVDIGTNVEYAVYVEYDDSKQHTTGKAHFLRDAATTHGDEYKKLVELAMKYM